jgi:hypothetical protein
MWIKKKTYKICTQMNLSFNKPYLFLITKTSIIRIKIASNFWIKQVSNKQWSILFLNKSLVKQFLIQMFTRYDIFNPSIYFYKLRLKGLGFRIIKQATGLYRFFFNRINYIYFYVPKNIIMFYKQRVLLFLSIHWDILRMVIVHVLALKKLSIYNMRGLWYPYQLRIKKPGKKRF